jgi:hypothetical protein
MAPQKSVMEVPKIERIHTKVYEAASAPNALNMQFWHSCETTHCRAGLVVHLAGEAGYKLEQATSVVFAAMQIHKASGSPISPTKFHGYNDVALADMKKLAEAEATS